MKPEKNLIAVVALLAVIALAGCSSKGGAPVTPLQPSGAGNSESGDSVVIHLPDNLPEMIATQFPQPTPAH